MYDTVPYDPYKGLLIDVELVSAKSQQ